MTKNEQFIKLLPLETERLIIKTTTTEDIDLILKMDKQENTQKHLGGVKNKTREERIAFLEKKENKIKNGCISSLTVCLKSDKTPIGFIGLDIDENNNNAEVSYIFDSDYCHKGYCTEAVLELLRISFDIIELNKIYADTVEDNKESIKLLEKIGFVKEGIRREVIFDTNSNKYKNFIDYGLLRNEYKIRKD